MFGTADPSSATFLPAMPIAEEGIVTANKICPRRVFQQTQLIPGYQNEEISIPRIKNQWFTDRKMNWYLGSTCQSHLPFRMFDSRGVISLHITIPRAPALCRSHQSNGANRVEAGEILLSFSASTELAQLCNKRRSRHTLRETRYSRTDNKLVHLPGA